MAVVPASASPIKIEFSGVVSQYLFNTLEVPCPNCEVPIGTIVTGSYTFTPNPDDLSQVLPGGNFEFDAGALSVSVPHLSITIAPSIYTFLYTAGSYQDVPDPVGDPGRFFSEEFELLFTSLGVPLSGDVAQVPTLGSGYFDFEFVRDGYGGLNFEATLTSLAVVPKIGA